MKGQAIKRFYDRYHDRILDKRYNSSYWIRRHTHRQIFEQFLRHIEPGKKVLDVGCGEGVLSLLLAKQKEATVTGTDISFPNIVSARQLAREWDISAKFVQADAENLPFPDNSFDVVISSHVLEHLPNLRQWLRELRRVTRSSALIAMPTCLNPSCWVLLGGDDYWKVSRRSVIALPLGLAKMLIALLRGDDGPNEGYAGNEQLPHVWRFPWVMRGQIEEAGFKVVRFEAGPLTIPYLAQYWRFAREVQEALDRWRFASALQYFGYGSLAVCEKCTDNG